MCYTVNPRSKEWKKGIVWNKTKFTLRCREFCCRGTRKTHATCLGGTRRSRTACGFRRSAPANACGSRHRVLRALYGSVPPRYRHLQKPIEARVLKLWEGLGYYSRARNLQKTAKLLTETQNGAFPDTAEALEKLPGIGAYTAGAVASICFEQPAAAVDGNVLRIIMRMTGGRPPDRPAAGKKRDRGGALQGLPERALRCVHAGAHGACACVCTPKSPKCEVCPTRAFAVHIQPETSQNTP